MSGFRKFLMQGNIIDLAVAVVIGVAFNAIVQALVKDMITPLITAIVGKHINFSSLSFAVNGATFYLRRRHQRGDLVPGHRGGGLLADRRADRQADGAGHPQQGSDDRRLPGVPEHHPRRRQALHVLHRRSRAGAAARDAPPRGAHGTATWRPSSSPRRPSSSGS